VVTIQEPLTPLRHNRAQPEFPVGQRQVPQVVAVAPKQIKGVKPGFPSPEQQVLELGFTMSVEDDDFAIENCQPGMQFGR